MIKGASFFLYIMSLVMLLVIWDPIPSVALEVEMPVCDMIQHEMGQGVSLTQGIFNIVTSNKNQEKTLFEATMKTLVRDAIKECQRDPILVFQAGFQAGIPISIIFTAAGEAGIRSETVERAIERVGADPSQIKKERPDFGGSGKPPISILRDKRVPIGSGGDK